MKKPSAKYCWRASSSAYSGHEPLPDVPVGFYYENVLKAPTLMREAAHYGTAMHNALQRLFERMKVSKDKAFATEAPFIQTIRPGNGAPPGFFSRKEYQPPGNVPPQPVGILQNPHLHLEKNVQLEHKPRNVEMDGVPITGSIDRLIPDGYHRSAGGRLQTGSQSDAKMRRPTDANPTAAATGGNWCFTRFSTSASPAIPAP